jgi:mannonate dehydratase
VDLAISSFGIQEENHFPAGVHEMLPGTAELRGGYLYGNGEPGLGIDVHEQDALKYPPAAIRPGDSWTTVRGMDGSIVKP